MNCPRCKATITKRDKYCPACGYPVQAGAPAQADGRNPKAPQDDYEEASTQLVDVDAFREYMAREQEGKEGEKGGSPARPGASGDDKAAASAPIRPTNIALSPGDIKTPDSGGGASRGARTGDITDSLPPIKQAASQKIILAVLFLITVTLVAFLAFRYLMQ